MEKRTYSTSEQTKHALAEALKTLMAQKPFDKITIHELTELSGIRRQHFYYHFEDVYDLLRWMFQEEAVSLLHEQDGAQLWQDGLLQVFRYVEANRAVCLCALNSVGRDCLKRFFENDIYSLIHHVVEEIGKDIGVIGDPNSHPDVDLMTHYYVVAVAGMLESWLTGEIDNSPEEIVAFINQIITDHTCGAKMRVDLAK